eukprot:scaffold78874_cov16-Prasinocladus_malaysianus.AAC.1
MNLLSAHEMRNAIPVPTSACDIMEPMHLTICVRCNPGRFAYEAGAQLGVCVRLQINDAGGAADI